MTRDPAPGDPVRTGWSHTAVLDRLTGYSLISPRSTLTIGLALATVALAFTITRLEFHTNRDDLIDPSSEFHRRWQRVTAEFPAEADVVIVVEGATTDSVTAAVDRLVERLAESPQFFRDVLGRLDLAPLRQRALHFLSIAQLRQLAGWVGPATRSIQTPETPWETWAELVSAMPHPSEALTRQNHPAVTEYIFVKGQTMAVVTARLIRQQAAFVPDPAPIKALEQIRRDVQAEFPQVEIGLTGLPILEYAEMQTSQNDMSYASILSLAGVAFLFCLGFHDWRYPLLGIISLMVGIAWTCGYMTWIVGHLNILSMSFGVILIGLGIDFAIHYAARYQHELAFTTSLDPPTALPSETAGAIARDPQEITAILCRTSRDIGPAIMAGGITTSMAFFATAATEFRGVAELGLIAGGGILLCTAATLLMMPSLLWTIDRYRPPRTQRRPPPRYQFVLQLLWRHPTLVTAASIVATLLLARGLKDVRFDHNLLELQAKGLSSVEWERRLLQETDRSTWFAVSLANNAQEAIQRKQALEALPTVASVEEIASLLPTSDPGRQYWIDQISADVSAVPDHPPIPAPLDTMSISMHAWNILAQEVADGEPFPPDQELRDAVERRANADRLHYARIVWECLQNLQAISLRDPPSMATLPPTIRSRFHSDSGTYLLRIFARGNPWDHDHLARFVKETESVDPQVTGHPIQAYYASRQMERSYYRAGFISAGLVAVVLLADFRHLGHALLAAIPTVLGTVQLFGLMGWLGIPLNPANIIVLPLVIGIGIDDGIHVVHDYRAGRSRQGLGEATTAGIVLTSLTSILGFGSLMVAHHQGLQSLGRVVSLGIACCLIVSTVTLPCVLALLPSPPSRPEDAPAS